MFQRDFQVHSAVSINGIWEVKCSCKEGFLSFFKETPRKWFTITYSTSINRFLVKEKEIENS